MEFWTCEGIRLDRPTFFMAGHYLAEADRYAGYVDMHDVSRLVLNDQANDSSHFLDGGYDAPVLGEGLDYQGSSEVNAHKMGIHPSHTQEFIQRVQAYHAAYVGRVYLKYQGSLVRRLPTPAEVAVGILFLASRDIFIDEEPVTGLDA